MASESIQQRVQLPKMALLECKVRQLIDEFPK